MVSRNNRPFQEIAMGDFWMKMPDGIWPIVLLIFLVGGILAWIEELWTHVFRRKQRKAEKE
jgi:hypothetical protein